MKIKKQLLFSLALSALFLNPCLSSGMSYSVKGSYSYQVFVLQKAGEPRKEAPLLREFEARLDGCNWKLRVVLVGNTNYDSFIYSYDGTNLLHYAILAGDGASVGAKREVTVEDSPVPATTTSAAGEYLWLAFASGCYLKAQTNNSVWSFDQLRSRSGVVGRYEVPCRFELSSFPPYLPTAVEYWRTNLAVVVGDDGVRASAPLPPMFGKGGYPSAVFKSGGFTNVHGLSFPREFEYLKYKPKPDAKTTNDLNCVVIVRGTVTSISTTEQRVDCALPSGRFMIHDLRVPEPSVLYPIDDGAIPAVDNSIVKVARNQAKLRSLQSAIRASSGPGR